MCVYMDFVVMQVSLLCRRALGVCHILMHPRIHPVPPMSAPPKARLPSESGGKESGEDEPMAADGEEDTVQEVGLVPAVSKYIL